MRILNIMLGAGLGGIEQAAFDTHEALLHAGLHPISLLTGFSAVQPQFDAADFETRTLNALGEWDLLAAYQLRRLALKLQVDAIICHGNRAVNLALHGFGRSKPAQQRPIPIIGVTHNYKIRKRFPRCDAVFCVTRDLLEECANLDIPRTQLFYVPNLTRLPSTAKSYDGAANRPLVIGSMGRFVQKKGFDIFLQALGILQQQGIPFQARIAGDGPLAGQLQAQAKQLGIAQQLEFVGWVRDTKPFLNTLDVFVLPSLHEPFGIALIEAMAAGLACVTSDTEGPCEIITPPTDALIVEKAKPHALAAALRELLDAPESLAPMGAAARHTIATRYDLPVISKQLADALQQIVRCPT
jgi:glycosyltransferase involved in cell wall biosynthesis